MCVTRTSRETYNLVLVADRTRGIQTMAFAVIYLSRANGQINSAQRFATFNPDTYGSGTRMSEKCSLLRILVSGRRLCDPKSDKYKDPTETTIATIPLVACTRTPLSCPWWATPTSIL